MSLLCFDASSVLTVGSVLRCSQAVLNRVILIQIWILGHGDGREGTSSLLWEAPLGKPSEGIYNNLVRLIAVLYPSMPREPSRALSFPCRLGFRLGLGENYIMIVGSPQGRGKEYSEFVFSSIQQWQTR